MPLSEIHLRLAAVLLAFLAGGARSSWAAGPGEIEVLAASLRPRLEAQFRAIEARLDSSRELTCNELRPLRLRGRYAECAQVADRCVSAYPASASARSSLSEIEQEGLREVLGEGALCLAELGKYKDARRWFLATSPLTRGRGRPYVALMRALLLVDVSEERNAVEALGSLSLDSTQALGLLQLMHPLGWPARPDPEQDERLRQWLAALDPGEPRILGQLWLGRISAMLDVEGRPLDALRALSERVELIDDPYASIRIAYQALFSLGLLDAAKSLYQAYLPHAHAEAWLPVEANTLTYGQLGAACPGALLDGFHDGLQDGEPLRRLQAIAQAWTTGRKDRSESLSQALQLQREFPHRADVDTLVGSLLESLGREQPAQAAYWSAHLECPYYDRAHWGLLTLKRTRKTSLPYAQETFQRSDKIVEKTGVPRAISTYVSNWASLNGRGQKQLLGAISPWLAHVSALVDAGYRLYVKRGFERVSDIPGLSSYRDTRVGGGDGAREASTQGTTDKRLWDDIRGLNASEQKLVVVDASDTAAALLGGHNLAGHEVAHQFHRMLASHDKLVPECILRLYQGARARAAFVTPIAALDEYEYFAESATAWMRDLPSWRIATAQGRLWLKSYDPRIEKLIDQLAQGPIAQGKLVGFRCPE